MIAFTILRRRLPSLIAIGVLLGGCGPSSGSSDAPLSREVLDDGTILLRYGALPPDPDVAPLEADLEIGLLDGPAHEVFGDVRGVEAGTDGEIYVLDFQSSDIRVFGPDGGYLWTIGGPGEGPGEITRANGILRAGDGTLWVNDHGKWQTLRLAPDGREIERAPMHPRSFGFVWDAVLDDRGRLWRATARSDGPQRAPESGLNEGMVRVHLTWFDPATEAADSIFVTEERFRSFVEVFDQGFRSRLIPFTPRSLHAVDPGGGFWTTFPDTYRLERRDENGDRVLVVEADVPPRPVTGAERRAFVEAMTGGDMPGDRRAAEEIASLMPSHKPVVDQLVVDDEGRLWVRRFASDDEPSLHDVFSREGEHLALLELAFTPPGYFLPRIREGHLYTLRLDALGVAQVVRVPLPELP